MGRVFYPIQVAEKGQVWLRAHFSGEAGHGSIPREDSAVVRAAQAIVSIAGKTPARPSDGRGAAVSLRELSAGLPAAGALRVAAPDDAVAQQNDPRSPGEGRRAATHAGDVSLQHGLAHGGAGRREDETVIPASAVFEIDGRTLPGQTEDDFPTRATRRHGPRREARRHRESQPPVVAEVDTPLFRCLCEDHPRSRPGRHPYPGASSPGLPMPKRNSRLGYYLLRLFRPIRFAPDDGLVFSALYHGKDRADPGGRPRLGLQDALRRSNTVLFRRSGLQASGFRLQKTRGTARTRTLKTL